MGHTFHPLVPVLVHEVINYASGGARQIRIAIGSSDRCLHPFDEKYLFAIGREGKSFNFLLQIRQLPHASPVGIYAPYLRGACLVAQESDLLSAFDPLGVALLRVGDGELFLSGAVTLHNE